MLNFIPHALTRWFDRVLRDRKNTLPSEAAENSRREREEENLLRMTL
jgi:hypothetical protein